MKIVKAIINIETKTVALEFINNDDYHYFRA
jgi:hypothetical protein